MPPVSGYSHYSIGFGSALTYCPIVVYTDVYPILYDRIGDTLVLNSNQFLTNKVHIVYILRMHTTDKVFMGDCLGSCCVVTITGPAVQLFLTDRDGTVESETTSFFPCHYVKNMGDGEGSGFIRANEVPESVRVLA